MKRATIALWMALVLSACGNAKDVTTNPETWNLTFGYSGGATNVPVKYMLMGNRDLYRLEGESKSLVNRVSRRQLKKIQGMIEDMNFRGIKLAERGNITHHISLNHADDIHAISWTDQTECPEVKELYRTLFRAVNR